MMAFGIIALTLIILAIWRRLNQKYVSIIYIYQLYKTRDLLRRAAIDGRVDAGHWIFEYYDNTISKLISERYYITVFSLTTLALRYTGDARHEEFSEKLQEETKKNEVLVSVREQITKATGAYVSKQHVVSLFFVKICIVPIIGAQKINKAVKDIFIYPETSSNHNQALT